MKRRANAITVLLLLTMCSICSMSFAQGANPGYFIDEEQKRIDLLDGAENRKLATGDEKNDRIAANVYFILIDSIQSLIENTGFEETKKKSFRDNLYILLRQVNQNNFYNVKRYDAVFRYIAGEIRAMRDNTLNDFLKENISLSFATFSFFRHEPCADSFLIYAAQYNPDLVFKSYDLFYNKKYALRVLEETAKTAPVTVKRYFTKGNGIYETLKMSKDTAIKTLLKIRETYAMKSNAYSLLDAVMSGKLTVAAADKTGANPQKYLKALIDIRSKQNPLGPHSVDAELEIYALKFVRVLNDLHDEKDAVRFASVSNFSAEEIYTLMVYSEEEIFTSTFNGLFYRLMVKIGPVSGFEFLQKTGDNRFRTFIKMAAGFGKLSGFLQSMTPLHQQMLMIRFASGLEQYHDLSQAVEVADAFGSITDTLVLKILRGTIRLEYLRLSRAKNQRGKSIYGLLSNLFVDRSLQQEDWFASVARQYALPGFDRIENQQLRHHDSVSRWLIYFYDDTDGEASFSNYVKTFSAADWTIADSGVYVLIQSKQGIPVHIYANKPKNEYDGQEHLERLFADSGFVPALMVHRGHSYYASKTIDKINESTRVFVLGSCGGYHSISAIIEKSQDISIISSKQIGTMFVNNPMLLLIAEAINRGQDLEWQTLWIKLKDKVKDNPTALERYLDYIPPHKNLGAIFIKTYNSLKGAK